jgi:hypothetical protein
VDTREEGISAQIRKLALADRAFEQCLSLLSFMMGMPEERREEPIALCMLSGICVTYCKNFLSSLGNGPLPDRYSRFDSPVFEQTHTDLIQSRHSIYAHRDLLRDEELNKETELNVALAKVEITFTSASEMSVVNCRKPL